jgi:hypothetical protein
LVSKYYVMKAYGWSGVELNRNWFLISAKDNDESTASCSGRITTGNNDGNQLQRKLV